MVRPKMVTLEEGRVRIEWSDGHVSVFANRSLRESCPCALCQGEPSPFGGSRILPVVPDVPPEVKPMDTVWSGSTRSRSSWSDGHNTGIYPYDFLLETLRVRQVRAASERLIEPRRCRVPAMSSGPGFEFLGEPVKAVLAELGIQEPTPPQVEASPMIARGENVLVIAPTGSGKTEAAMLPLLSTLVRQGHGDGISIIYITPLRALNRDMLRRLEMWCSRLSLTIDVRHGDTPQAQRQRQSRKPPDVLVTTPETLQAVLPGVRMRSNLATVKAVVVDELHNLVESKRGVQLTVGLERLRKVAGDFQLVGLSATVGSPRGDGSIPLRRERSTGS